MKARRLGAAIVLVLFLLVAGASWVGYSLGYYHALRGGIATDSNVDEAVGYFLAAYEKNPDAFMVAHDLACCYALKGDQDSCITWLTRALGSSYGDYAKRYARTERAFDSVRSAPRFQELIYDD